MAVPAASADSTHPSAHSAERPVGVTKSIASDIRLYGFRASYHLPAALSILRESPVAHVAFVHPEDDKRDETIMNIPLISVCMLDPDIPGEEVEEDNEDHWAFYLHTHRQSGLVEAIQSGIKSLTASTLKIDGMILSPTAHDHSLNYRSATFHLCSPLILSDDVHGPHHEEKRAALAAVTSTVTGYNRTDIVGLPNDPNVQRTTVIKCKIRSASCKQRYGAFSGGKEPELEVPTGKEEHAFTGVVPCWTTWGTPLGYGRDEDEVKRSFEQRTEEGKRYAESNAWASEDASIEGLGKKRKPKAER